MKKSLSLLVAATAAAVFVPLSFADSSSSVASSATSSSVASVSSSSALSSMGPVAACSDKKGMDKVLCMNAEAQKKKVVAEPKSSNKALSLISSCASTKGIAKLLCLRKVNKAVVKTMIKVETKIMQVNNNLGKKVQGTMVSKPALPEACVGKRGGELALCLQNLKKSSAASSTSSEAN